MSQHTTISDVIWTPEPGGEYNQHHATIAGHAVMIFSDRDGEQWEMQIGESDTVSTWPRSTATPW